MQNKYNYWVALMRENTSEIAKRLENQQVILEKAVDKVNATLKNTTALSPDMCRTIRATVTIDSTGGFSVQLEFQELSLYRVQGFKDAFDVDGEYVAEFDFDEIYQLCGEDIVADLVSENENEDEDQEKYNPF
jgi:hypothetical protein